MATEKQVNYVKKLLIGKGVDPDEYKITLDVPHANISSLIGELMNGSVPDVEDWLASLPSEPIQQPSGSSSPSSPSGMSSESVNYNKSVFNLELSYLKGQAAKMIVNKLLEAAPKYFFDIPASSTGKYHPDFALGKGGLVRHSKAAAKIAYELLQHPIMYDFTPLEADAAIAATIVHDITKNGMTDETNSGYTCHEHPLLVDKLADSIGLKALCTSPETDESIVNTYSLIMEAISSHMGPWNTNPRSPFVLPMPESDIQAFVHMCDYLASRKYIEVKI